MARTALLLVLGIVVGAGLVMVLGGTTPGDTNTTTATETVSGTATVTATDTVSQNGTGTDSGVSTATATVTATPTPTAADDTAPSNAEITSAIAESVQSSRVAQSEIDRRLNRTEELDRVAHHHSRDMALNDFFAHEAPWGDTLDDRMVQEDVSCSDVFDAENGEFISPQQLIYRTSGETLPSADDIADGARDAWLSNDRDEEYLTLEEWTEFGVSTRRTTEDGETTAYVTVVFC